MQPQENVSPMDEVPSGMLDSWSQETLCMQLKQLFDENYFNILQLNNLIYGFNTARDAHGLPAVRGKSGAEYGALEALHCVAFADMLPTVRAGIASAVLRVLSLDEEWGNNLFGITRWTDVMQHFGQLQAAPQAGVEHENADPERKGTMEKITLLEREKRLLACQKMRKHVRTCEAEGGGPRENLALRLAFAISVLTGIGLAVMGQGIPTVVMSCSGVFFVTCLLVMGFSRTPKTHSEQLDVLLTAYDPIDREAYRHLQAQALASELITPKAVLVWLKAEEKAIRQAARIPKPELTFLNKQV
ncbi:hypothetical protein D9M71_462920 [compost metagenome]